MFKDQTEIQRRVRAAYQLSASHAGALPEDLDQSLTEWRQELRLAIQRQNSGGPEVDWQKCLDEFNELSRRELMPEL